MANVPRRLLSLNWSNLLISSGNWQWYWMTLIKSVAVNIPANRDVCEFHNGADTIAMLISWVSIWTCVAETARETR